MIYEREVNEEDYQMSEVLLITKVNKTIVITVEGLGQYNRRLH